MAHPAQKSTLRRIISDQLAAQELTLHDLLTGTGSIDDITYEIRRLTGIPVSSRTVRRWVESTERRETAS